MKNEPTRILQIVPAAPGWRSVFHDADGFQEHQVAVFALVERPEQTNGHAQSVIPLDYIGPGALSDPETVATFVGLAAPGETAEQVLERWKRWIDEEETP